MKKRSLFFTLLTMMGLAASASPVSKGQARAVAAAFLRDHHAAATLQGEPQRAPRKINGQASKDAAYYIFNTTGNQGYVIVSGDDRTVSVLGYTDQGHFDAGRIPANMKAWLDGYAEQMGRLSQLSDAEARRQARTVRKDMRRTRSSISPLITTNWDQATPYWNKCPQFMTPDGGAELAYTGCVATAMAQIMKYHQWPKQTTQPIPSYTFSYPLGNYEYATATTEELPVTTFDWDHMRDNYTGAEDTTSTQAVATLMQYAGYAVKMMYSTSSSGAYTDDIPRGFTRYFDYNKDSLHIAFRNDYDQQRWDDLIYNELVHQRPVIYNGTAGSGGGHSFICDGYEYGDYFHINWGWGGMGNGFFVLSVLNPYESGIGGAGVGEGYNMKQNAIVGIIPGHGETATTPAPSEGDQPVDTVAVQNVLTVTGIACNSYNTTMELERDGKSKGFSIYKRKTFDVIYSDHQQSDQKYLVGIALYDEEGKFVNMVAQTSYATTVTTAATGDRTQFGKDKEARNPIRFGQGLTGKYRIVPVCQLAGSKEWKPMLESDRFYFACDITNYSATITCHPVVDLEATKFEFVGGEKVGKAEKVKVTLKNNSDDRYFGDLYLWVEGEQLDPTFTPYTTTIQAEVAARGEKEVVFNFTPRGTGKKNIGLSTDDQGEKKVKGQGMIDIAASEASDSMKLSVVIKALNADSANVIYDSHAQFAATITNHGNGEYNKYVLAPLFIVTKDAEGHVTGGKMVTYKQENLSLAKDESRTLYFDFDNLAYGSTYSLNIYARNDVADDSEESHLTNIVQKGQSVYYDIQHGIIVWKSDGERTGVKADTQFVVPEHVCAVSLEGTGVTRVKPNDNPNTLYFVGTDEEAPSGCTTNIIRAGQASEIRLVDGHDFFTPFAFIADTISYSREVSTTLNADGSEGWSTITLPFAATAVSINGESSFWNRTADDTYPLYLYDFVSENEGMVTFDKATLFAANHPYLLGVDPAVAGKTLTFSAAHAKVSPEAVACTSGNSYLFAGTYVDTVADDVLQLDAPGASFQDGTDVVSAFRAYFRQLTASAVRKVDVVIPGISTGIRSISQNDKSQTQRYNLSGQRVEAGYQGVFIQNGKKYSRR